ncbi:MAG: UvrD-helicase domain-containing protein [Myxococcales bacterium]|nr:UvrD-helicase domain-containing protein [Myxococcales bacterium]
MNVSPDTAALADAPARARIATDLDTTLIVEAAAGTGKTTALVARMVAALAAGHGELRRMAAVTFTELAAGELKLRLRGGIERARLDAAADSAAARNLSRALEQLEEASIGTIHSFCSDLLRERPVEAGVDPLFEVAAADVAEDLFEQAFGRWFEEALKDPPEGVRRILRRTPPRGGSVRDLLREAARDLAERRDFTAPWRTAAFAREDEIDALMVELEALGRHAAAGDRSDYFYQSLAEIDGFVQEVRRREAIWGRDYDGLEAELLQLPKTVHWHWTGFVRGPTAALKTELRAERSRVQAHLAAFADAVGADLAPRLQAELRPAIDRYQALKRRAGRLDFNDLLLVARDLLRRDAGVRRDYQERFTHIFVDEFQDTDPLQAEILILLAAGDPQEADWTRVQPKPGKLFIVGDPKQSIYRFRRADVALYEEVKRRLVAAGAVLQHLTVSFRALPEIQAAVNAALAPRMAGATASQAAYVPLVPARAPVATQPAIVALPVPAPYGDYGKIVDWRIEQSLPDAAAAFVAWLVRESGWTVSDSGGRRRPLEPRDVCMLFRRFKSFTTDVTHAYVRALEARHLPHVLVGGTGFHAREEIEALRNVLAAIERPDDELAVFATLRGPFFALGDGALLAFHERFGTLHPFRRVPDELPPALAEVAEAMALLRDLHRGRNRRPLADTIARFLAATRAHAGVAIWPAGEQALANVMRLMDLARRAERQGITSFRAFVDRLAAADRVETGEAPILEEGTGGVRLMTVHRAKGLEFPVVLLADPTAKEAPGEPSRYTDAARGLCALRIAGCSPSELLAHRDEERERDREEAARILYVAATRARDLLVVPVIGDARHDGWLAALHPVVYPDESRRRRPESATAPACPRFGPDSVAERSERTPGREQSVAPGVHVPEVGDHRVVWWDPKTLTLGLEENVGLRQQRLLQADEDGTTCERGVRAHAAWCAARTRVRAEAGRPAVAVVTATAWAAAQAAAGADGDGPESEPSAASIPTASAALAALAAAVEVQSARADDTGARPVGVRFGVLVHAALAVVDLEAGREAVAAAVALQARLTGATAEEAAAAIAVVCDALAHPLVRQAAAAARSGVCRREVALACRLDDGTLVEGVADLVFRGAGDDRWTVVDFKTDRDVALRLAEYRWQLAAYAYVVTGATGAGARAVVLGV